MDIKINPIISILVISLAIALFAIVIFMFAKDAYAPTENQQPASSILIDREEVDLESPNNNKPPIVDFFACSDNCPGSREQYMIKIYEGVKDETECNKLGGALRAITGWGARKVCEVQQEEVFCTQDAKQCLDGTYVGRTGPDCEFTPCPGQ